MCTYWLTNFTIVCIHGNTNCHTVNHLLGLALGLGFSIRVGQVSGYTLGWSTVCPLVLSCIHRSEIMKNPFAGLYLYKNTFEW
jgi:hypothetical protein